MKNLVLKCSVLSLALAGFVVAGAEKSEAGVVEYSFVGSFDGNGCSGSNTEVAPGLVQGNIETGECTYDLSEAILKFDGFNDSDTPSSIVTNTEYSAFDSDWIDFGFDEDLKGGDWSYDPTGDEKIGITAAYFKAGNSYFLYTFSEVFYGSDTLTFDWDGGGSALSNAVFFNFKDNGGGGGCDNGDCPPPVPLPAGLPLILAGMGAFGVLRMHKKRS